MDSDSPKRSALPKAFLASFAVYLMPIIGPHAFWLLGEYLYSRTVRGGPDHVAAWIAMDWGLAIVLQIVAAALWYWFFARPKWWRLLPLVVCVPVYFFVIEWAYLVAIPTRFLVEQDTASETGDWKTVCTVPDMTLAMVRSTPDMSLERAGQVWLVGTGMNVYAVLDMPDCQTTPARWPEVGASFTQPFVAPGGRCLFSTWDNKAGLNRWWYRDGAGHAPRLLPRPPADPNRCTPILSTDGDWVAWLKYIPAETVTPLPQHVVIRCLRDERERIVNMPPPGLSELVLVGLSMDEKLLGLYEHEYTTRRNSIAVFDLNGARVGRQVISEDVDPQATTFVSFDKGWAAWDAYRESEPYRVAWSLAKGHGTHQILKGRSITAVAVNPSGTHIAISTTTSLNIGHIKDAVYVVRASDGVEVWRRYLPAYTRSPVTFLGDQYFAYTDWDGAHAAVRVLQIPD